MITKRTDMVVTRWSARFMGRTFPVSVGRSGIRTLKAEGDMATPAGVWRLLACHYRADRRGAPIVPTSLARSPIGHQDLWSDDPHDSSYNQHVKGANYPFSHEKMRLTSRLYDVVLVTDWNYPDAKPGLGSAIFVHQWRKPRHPTAGCLAFHPLHLAWILSRWRRDSRIVVR